ncbi:hypothetical protein HA402_007577 [Bradysia odoriphaga]|nr:hypothetical protein HA402_007577 [Bradysia odoriphaga]
MRLGRRAAKEEEEKCHELESEAKDLAHDKTLRNWCIFKLVEHLRIIDNLNCEKLKGNAISETDVAILVDAGNQTVESLIETPKKNLMKISGISDSKATAIHREAMKCVDVGFQTAHEVYTKRSNIIRLTTGSSRSDTLLGGGIETGSITEVYGEFRTGKTQLCHTLAVTCQLPIEVNGVAAKCLYIDTEGTFRPKRIVAIAKRFNLNPTETLNNIVVARAFSSDHQTEFPQKRAVQN